MSSAVVSSDRSSEELVRAIRSRRPVSLAGSSSGSSARTSRQNASHSVVARVRQLDQALQQGMFASAARARSTRGWPFASSVTVDVDLHDLGERRELLPVEAGLLQAESGARTRRRDRPARGARWPIVAPRCSDARSTSASSYRRDRRRSTSSSRGTPAPRAPTPRASRSTRVTPPPMSQIGRAAASGELGDDADRLPSRIDIGSAGADVDRAGSLRASASRSTGAPCASRQSSMNTGPGRPCRPRSHRTDELLLGDQGARRGPTRP